MGTDATGRHRTSRGPVHQGAASRWRPLLLALAALLAFPVVFALLRVLMALTGGRDTGWPLSPATLSLAAAVALGVAGLVVGLRSMAQHVHPWPVVAGTTLSGLVALGWSAFGLAELMVAH